jgi:hypothetical protein
MMDLKEYIEESLLDDFDTLNKKVTDVIKHPFGNFWNNVVNSGNWEDNVKELEANLAWNAKPGNSGMKDLSKGQVLVVFFKLSTSDLTKIYIRYSNSDWAVVKKYFKSQVGRTPTGYNSPELNITSLVRKNNRPHMSLNAIKPYKQDGYLLSKEDSQDAIDMLNKFVHNEWASYWKGL